MAQNARGGLLANGSTEIPGAAAAANAHAKREHSILEQSQCLLQSRCKSCTACSISERIAVNVAFLAVQPLQTGMLRGALSLAS
jgi:hypothetical protein